MYITIIITLLLVTIGVTAYTYRLKKALKKTNLILDDIATGNLDRKLISNNISERSEFAVYCYKVNEIVAKYKKEIEELEQSEKNYKRLITSLSHDVRTPLASLSGYLNAIKDDVVNHDEKEDFLKLSLDKADILRHYIDTLFEWLKLESGEQIFNFEKMDLNELMKEIIAEWIPQLEQNNITYEVDIPDDDIELTIDRESLCRIINNIMNNILIHSGTNAVDIKMIDDENNVWIYIRDYGIGISENDLKYIFDRLYKCDSARSNRGNGLGLAIVSELVKANNGDIHVDSTLGEGSCFTLEFSKTLSDKQDENM